MTEQEESFLLGRVNELNLKSGKVIKANGRWYISGQENDVPLPRIGDKPETKLGMWIEGTKKVVIELR